MTSWDALDPQTQALFTGTYGQQAAPYVWQQQAGVAPPAGAGFGALPQADQNTWYGTYQGAAPSVWEQQSGFTSPAAPSLNQTLLAASQAQPYLGRYPSVFGGGTVAPSTPMTIGAGTAGVQYGYGIPGFGQQPLTIRPEYLSQLQNLPGYIPGSGTFNQFRLDQPGLFGTVGGVPNQIMTWGSGAAGDPSTGTGPQTPEQWVQSPRLFTWEGMAPKEKGWLPNMFGRSDTPSGISTEVLGAPASYWQGLAQEIASGFVKPTAAGWQFLQSVKGMSPQTIGGAAPQQATTVGYTGASGAGGQPGAPGGAGAGGFDQGEYWNNQARLVANAAAEVAYQRSYYEWLARHGDETLAQTKAKDAATDAYQQATIAVQREQEARLERAQQQNVGVQAAQLMGQLRGPSNQFAAANALYGLGRVPGVPNAIAALAGQYDAPRFQAPQGLPQASTLSTLAQQLGSVGTGQGGDLQQQAQQFASQLPTPNKILGRQFVGMDPATQQLALAGYESLGMNPESVLNTIKAGLPTFQAPAYGQVG